MRKGATVDAIMDHEHFGCGRAAATDGRGWSRRSSLMENGEATNDQMSCRSLKKKKKSVR